MRTPQAVASMSCPVCTIGLALSDRSGIEIDYCPSCRGVWLDRGELDKIIERSADAALPSRRTVDPPRSHDRPCSRGDDDDRDRRGKRKRSFLSELFD